MPAGSHTIELLGYSPLGGNNTALFDQVTLAPANALSDGSFETPALNSGTYEFGPTGSNWNFSGGGGIATNGSTYTFGNPNAPDGTQVAILEGNGSMSQSVDLLAGSYNISFDAAQFANNTENESQQIEVVVDGADVGSITPLSTGYELYQTSNFMISAAQAQSPVNVEFVGTNPQGGSNSVLIDLVSLTASSDQVSDGTFATPVLAASSYVTATNGSPWQFSGLSGITANGSAITSGSANAPSGTQAAFIMNGSSMTYNVYLDADTYSLSLESAQRAKAQSQNQQIEILVDNIPIGWILPTSTKYAAYQAPNFTVGAGMHTITFQGVNPPSGQSTVLIDNVSIAAAENTLSNGGFETAVLAAKTYAVSPSGSGWNFSGDAGITTNGSGFTNVTKGSLNAPDGAQVAFIKNNGAVSQAVWFDAGTYNVSFLASQRINSQTQNQQIQVWVGSQLVGTITPPVATAANSTASNTTYLYTLCQTGNFTIAAAGAYTVTFKGTTPASGDSTAFIDDATITAGCALVDGSFDTPALPAKAYQITPVGSGWQFTGAAGISTNGSVFTAGNPNAPNNNNQFAFIKDTGSISQSVDMAAGTYNVSFLAAQRAVSQASYESLAIYVDGNEVGTVTPSGTTYGQYATTNFTVSAGSHIITIVGVDPSGEDNTAFLDDVQLNV